MKFIEQHCGDAAQFRIAQDLLRENALGDDFDPRRAGDFGPEPHAIPDRFADPFAQRLGHALGTGPRRDAPRLKHDDLAVAKPGFIE